MDHSSKSDTKRPEIVWRDVAELRLHPLNKNHFPEPAKDSPQWHSFVDNLSAAGPEGIPPLFITPQGLVMKGGRRWRAAKQLQWAELPCIERPESEAPTILLESLIGQRDMDRGAKVYIALGFLEDYVKAANARRLANLRPSGRRNLETEAKPLIFSKSSNWTSSDDAKAIWERFGIGRTTWFQALHVRALLTDPNCKKLASLYADAQLKVPALAQLQVQQQTLREEFEPQLFSGEKNLWNVASAIGGRISTEDVNPQIEFNFAARFRPITHILEQARGRKQLEAWIAKADDRELEALEQLAQTLATAIEKRKEEA